MANLKSLSEIRGVNFATHAIEVVGVLNVNADATVWDDASNLGNYPWDNTWELGDKKVTVASTDANDSSASSGARIVRLFGLDGEGRWISEDVTMSGTFSVTSTNTFSFIQEARVQTTGAVNSQYGAITVLYGTYTISTIPSPSGTSPGGRSRSSVYVVPSNMQGWIGNVWALWDCAATLSAVGTPTLCRLVVNRARSGKAKYEPAQMPNDRNAKANRTLIEFGPEAVRVEAGDAIELQRSGGGSTQVNIHTAGYRLELYKIPGQ